jgi:hypothetical protein
MDRHPRETMSHLGSPLASPGLIPRRRTADANPLAPAQVPAGLTISRRRKAFGSVRARCDVSTASDGSLRTGFAAPSNDPDEAEPKPDFRRKLARCWALLLARIYECLPLKCPKCGQPMRIIAFVLDAPTIERILDHIGEPTQPPAVLPARSPPQLAFGFDQAPATTDWPEMDQTAGQGGGWEQAHGPGETVVAPQDDYFALDPPMPATRSLNSLTVLNGAKSGSRSR